VQVEIHLPDTNALDTQQVLRAPDERSQGHTALDAPR
jgi:hypothetical protein